MCVTFVLRYSICLDRKALCCLALQYVALPKSPPGGTVGEDIRSEAEMRMSSLCGVRKQWRRDHPFGFFAKPVRTPQGILDLKKWECGVPGKDKTLWEGGLFKLDVLFPDGRIHRGL